MTYSLDLGELTVARSLLAGDRAGAVATGRDGPADGVGLLGLDDGWSDGGRGRTLLEMRWRDRARSGR
jgi:hypothetical protein